MKLNWGKEIGQDNLNFLVDCHWKKRIFHFHRGIDKRVWERGHRHAKT